MYDKRVKIFIICIAAALLLCLLRLAQMQLLSGSFYRDQVAKLKLKKGLSQQLKTIRGKILDRKGEILAADELEFVLHINHYLCSCMDERIWRSNLLKAAGQSNSSTELSDTQKELQTGLEDLQQIIDKCTYFGLSREDIESKINNINDRIWNLRTFVAWVRNGPSPDILEKYNNKIESIPLSEALADFEKNVSSQNQRLILIAKVDDLAELNKSWPILELKTDDDVFTAQLEFTNIDGVEILPKAHRYYPLQSVASQTIGWVGPPQESDKALFEQDRLSRYLDDEEEVCGREDGAEYVFEAILRGRRGQLIFDIDRQLINRTQTEFGKDVSLTLDIELQKRIEDYLSNSELNPNYKASTAAVVIDVASSDILAFVSLPTFDLNRARYDYDIFASDTNEPFRNRAINKQFPPGSAIKPLILIAGLESGKITEYEVIACPAKKAPRGWPSCWIYNRYPGVCHDDSWTNYARNAIKGSCNIYFTRLADRIGASELQKWLFDFGYGHKLSLASDEMLEACLNRTLRQAQGQISNIVPKNTISDVEQLPPLERSERRYFGIGQGNFRATPLQVANAMAAIARDGLYKPARLFIDEANNPKSDGVDLNISPQTLAVVYDGMRAVVSEVGGTAYKEFAPILASFAEQNVTVYGKTGSTEKPDHAWFSGFAKDNSDRAIAIAVIVEGGQHGSSDAAPLARDIIQFCIEAKYIGP
jgi:penicillin-binding protein 2